jgi:hypothetical protein
MLTSECRTLALSKSQNQALARCVPQVRWLQELSTVVAAPKRRFDYRTLVNTHLVPHRGSERNRYTILDSFFCPICFSHYIAKSFWTKTLRLLLNVCYSHCEIYRIYCWHSVVGISIKAFSYMWCRKSSNVDPEADHRVGAWEWGCRVLLSRIEMKLLA